MNTIKTIDTEYLRPSRTIDTVLFNAEKAANFIYEITGTALTVQDIQQLNRITVKQSIVNRIGELIVLGARIEFKDIESIKLKLNLQLIDGDLSYMLSQMLLYRYTFNTSYVNELLALIIKQNPLHYDLSAGHPFYEYKIKKFLFNAALGMTHTTLWARDSDISGEIKIVKDNGDIDYFNSYNRHEFENYLINNTRLEQASTSRYGFGEVYEENGRYFIKLNLQVRFK